ncbi:Flagellar hook-associated protein 3 [Gimesia chilikensis]|uniref:Flagellar hook-associated protein 3 n=1 Tax=Gimesia chilikensis TaxID=2605989 RepID=A0A517W7F9_9PLAN|nr:flagellar hook-associated protein FlgL [Gimesia chilikensis]QDU01173.1 Flagellar hook-associated protein 3 [Gimesia chilikensis]
MNIGPLLPGRLPSTMLSERLKTSLNSNARELSNLQQQVATGQKFSLLSESPAAALRTIILQSTLERQLQYQTNISTNQSLLAMSETAMNSVGDALNTAKTLALSGVGSTVSDAERVALADQVAALRTQVINAGNTTFRGQYLFSGSLTNVAPFQELADGQVVYSGDGHQVQSYIDTQTLLSNNFDGISAFAASSPEIGSDIDPALTLQTRIADLHSGRGAKLGSISVTLDNGTPETQTIDLSRVETIQDLKTVLENAFSGSPVTLTVDIDPSSQNGLRLTPSAGTVAVSNVSGSNLATQLGIASTAVAQINGGDLDPGITLQTTLASLNGGTGIGSTVGTGLVINNGGETHTVDLSTATTIEDVFNLIRTADPNLNLGINEARNGLAISSRISGADFSIGENNGGSNAAGLGIATFSASTPLSELNYGRGVDVNSSNKLQINRRDGSTINIDLSGATTVQDVLDKINDFETFDGTTPLADLNLGQGVPVGATTLDITRRDGSVANVSLAGDATVQDVLDSINAVDPGNLVASIDPDTNAIRITDNSGTGPLSIASNAVSDALGLAVSETGTDNSVPLQGNFIPIKLQATLNTTGNGITIYDASGTGPLEIPPIELAYALGIDGTESGSDPLVGLQGKEPNPKEATGVINLLSRLETALRNNDSQGIERIGVKLDAEINRVNGVRSEIGNRLSILEDASGRLQDQEVQIREAISRDFDTDLTEVIVEITQRQTAFQANLQVTSQALQLTLLSYL